MLQDGCEKVMRNIVWQHCVHIKKTFLENIETTLYTTFSHTKYCVQAHVSHILDLPQLILSDSFPGLLAHAIYTDSCNFFMGLFRLVVTQNQLQF